MLDPQLLPRFLLLAHAIGAVGLAAWYLGAIPRGAPERRYLPLGIYMSITMVTCLVGWLASFQTLAVTILPWVNVGGSFGATAAMIWAFRVAVQPGDAPDNWPLSLRLSLLAHLSSTFLVPRLFEVLGWTVSSAVFSLPGIAAMLWLIFSQLGRLRRKGHYLHWSMAGGVLGCVGLGWILVWEVHQQAWMRIEEDLVRQATVVAEALGPTPSSPEEVSINPRFESALRSACTTSPIIGGAFILHMLGEQSEFVATTFDPGKAPAPRFPPPDHYNYALTLSGPSIDSYREGNGERWITVLSPLRPDPLHGGSGVVGFIASSSLIQLHLAGMMLATESILLLVALVIYVCIAGYLHGLERIWQRDTLLEANAIVAQRLLHAPQTDEIAGWLVDHLHEQLHLVHASFLRSDERHGQAGSKLIAAQPPVSPSHPWYPHAGVSPQWINVLEAGERLEGSITDINPPVPGLFPPYAGSPWMISESIVFHEKNWGTLTLVFPVGSRVIRSEIRSALRSISTAFAFCLAREERREHLAAAEDQLRTIIDTTPDGFWDADYRQNRHYRSPQWWQILGYETPQGRAPTAHEEYIEPEDLLQLRAAMQEILPQGKRFRRRLYRARHLDGSWRWIETNAVEIRQEEGPASRALGFDRDVTERRQYEDRLRSAAETAARANQAKSEFLATMSHELRTPLNSVIGFASILDRSALNATQRDWVSSMRTSAEQLLGLISDVLDFSRIEAGRLELELAPFELQRAAEQSLEHFARQATDKHIALHLHFEPQAQPIWVKGDVLRLRQIITNLVGNAVKFTEEGYVTLAVRALEDNRWEFKITDTGPGIAPELVPTLFDRFSQLDPSTTRKHGGTGLGLAISRQLARSMQGDIVATSKVNQGSEFTLTAQLPTGASLTRRVTDHPVDIQRQIAVLHPDANDLTALENTLYDTGCEIIPFTQVSPLIDYVKNASESACVIFPQAFRPAIYETARQLRELFAQHRPPVQLIGLQCPAIEPTQTSPFDLAMGAPIRRRELLNAIGDRTLDTSAPFDSLRDEIKKAPSLPPFASKPLRVLVAEDHPVNREVIGTMLGQLHVSADYADDGEAAIDFLTRKTYDLALIDIQMPIVDGYGVAAWVRSSWHGRWAPPRMVAVTANATRGDRQKCLDAGMDDFMPKPITFIALSDLINDLLPTKLPVPALPSAMNASSDSDASTPSAPLPGDLLIDWASFESIIGFTNAAEEPEVLRRIIATYAEDSVKILDEVEPMSPDEHGEARKLLHKLKGSSGSLAFAGAMSTIKKLHDPMESPPADERAELLARIRLETAQCIAAVRNRYPYLNVDPT
jgi:PAS domain S-box-containing protein